jgi:hypothetical protein
MPGAGARSVLRTDLLVLAYARAVRSGRRVDSTALCAACLALAGCAAATPRPATAPRRTELVVDEATVVQVPSRTPAGRDPSRSRLPAMPGGLERASPAFRHGYELAVPLLQAPGPEPPPTDDQPTYDTWLKATLIPWLDERGQAVEQALGPLGEVAQGSAAERTAAAALVGLIYEQVHGQLLAVPAPPAVRADEKLLRIYQDQVNETSASWVRSAVGALRSCAVTAAAQRDAAYGPWLSLCQDRLGALEQQVRDAKTLHDAVAAERAADAAAEQAAPPPDATSGASRAPDPNAATSPPSPAATPDTTPVPR